MDAPQRVRTRCADARGSCGVTTARPARASRVISSLDCKHVTVKSCSRHDQIISHRARGIAWTSVTAAAGASSADAPPAVRGRSGRPCARSRGRRPRGSAGTARAQAVARPGRPAARRGRRRGQLGGHVIGDLGADPQRMAIGGAGDRDAVARRDPPARIESHSRVRRWTAVASITLRARFRVTAPGTLRARPHPSPRSPGAGAAECHTTCQWSVRTPTKMPQVCRKADREFEG